VVADAERSEAPTDARRDARRDVPDLARRRDRRGEEGDAAVGAST